MRLDETSLITLLQASPLLTEAQQVLEKGGETIVAADIVKLIKDSHIQVNEPTRGTEVTPGDEEAEMLAHFEPVTEKRVNILLSSICDWIVAKKADPELRKGILALLHDLELPLKYIHPEAEQPPPAKTRSEQDLHDTLNNFLLGRDTIEDTVMILKLMHEKKLLKKLEILIGDCHIQFTGGPDKLKDADPEFQKRIDAYKPVTRKRLADVLGSVYEALWRHCAREAPTRTAFALLMEQMNVSLLPSSLRPAKPGAPDGPH